MWPSHERWQHFRRSCGGTRERRGCGSATVKHAGAPAGAASAEQQRVGEPGQSEAALRERDEPIERRAAQRSAGAWYIYGRRAARLPGPAVAVVVGAREQLEVLRLDQALVAPLLERGELRAKGRKIEW